MQAVRGIGWVLLSHSRSQCCRASHDAAELFAVRTSAAASCIAVELLSLLPLILVFPSLFPILSRFPHSHSQCCRSLSD